MLLDFHELVASAWSCVPTSQCPLLRKLYLSNNRIIIIDPLQDLPNLESLCLFRNMVLDLNRALLTLQQVAPRTVLHLSWFPCLRT